MGGGDVFSHLLGFGLYTKSMIQLNASFSLRHNREKKKKKDVNIFPFFSLSATTITLVSKGWGRKTEGGRARSLACGGIKFEMHPLSYNTLYTI